MEKRLSSDSKRAQFVRFCINGCLAVAIQYAAYYLLLLLFPEGSDLWTNVAYAVSYIISFCCNFIITSYWTFHSRPSWKRLVGFGSSHVVNFFAQLGFLNLYLWLGIPRELAALLAMGSAVPINFLLLRLVYRPVKTS